MQQATTPIIHVEQLGWVPALGKGKQKDVLQGLSYQIPKGAMVGIVGPNGAGKTSMLRCLLGLIEDYSGSIHIQGKDIHSLSRKALAQTLASVPQHSDSLFELTVSDVVQMGLLPHKSLFELNTKQDENAIQQALQRVGMADRLWQRIDTLSGGELQRILIARALVQQADILVLDEPTNHLDVYYQHQVLQLLQHLDFTILMTIHDLNLAARYCDHVLLLDKGEMRGFGTPQEVFQADVLSEVFGLPCAVENIPKDSEKAIPSICFHPGDNLWDSNGGGGDEYENKKPIGSQAGE